MFLLCFLLLIVTFLDFFLTTKEVRELRHDLNDLSCKFISYRIRSSAQIRYLEHYIRLVDKDDDMIFKNEESEAE